MRTFIGIKLDSCLAEIETTIKKLHELDTNASFTKLSNVHITLEFLGEISEKDIIKIKEILAKLSFEEFELKTDKLTSLRDMLIISIIDNPKLAKLQLYIHNELLKEGFKLESRKYYPHITLARKARIITTYPLEIKTKVEEIILFSSTRVNNELVYQPLLKQSLLKKN